MSEREAAGQRWDTSLYDSQHGYVWRFGEAVLELLAPQAGERILDLGAGTGHLTEKIARAGASVVGLDASQSMVEQARAAYPQIEFHQADAAAFSFDEPFDAVFSNATLHWVGRPDDVAGCVSRALKPGGRFVAEFGGRGNVGSVVDAVQTLRRSLNHGERVPPWYFPTIGEYTPILEEHGLAVSFAAHFDRPTPQADGDAGLRSWLEMFCSPMLEDLEEDERARLIDGVEDLLRPVLFRDGTWFVDYRRLRIVARKLQP